MCDIDNPEKKAFLIGEISNDIFPINNKVHPSENIKEYWKSVNLVGIVIKKEQMAGKTIAFTLF